MSTGSGIIFWIMGKDGIPAILVGKESIYISDLTVDSKTKRETEFGKQFGARINALENTVTTEEEEAKTYFRRGARELEGQLGLGAIRYDTPHRIGSNQWHVNYRYLPKEFKRGIIKGGREGSEDAKQTILREIAEELGLILGSTEIAQMIFLGDCRGYSIFSLQINDAIWRVIREKIADRREKKSGEVFDLDFKPISYLKSPGIYEQLNDKTACSINLFDQYLVSLSSTKKTGGTKRRRNKGKHIKRKKTKKTKTRRARKTRK